jgi:hypothetical protein
METFAMPASLPARLFAALLIAGLAAPALAQDKKEPAVYEPSSGQEGKDVVWVPTPQVLVDKMLDMARVTKRDFVMDLGSGDGPHRDHRRQARRARAGRRVQPRHGGAVGAQRGEGRRRGAREVHEGGPLRDRLLARLGDHHVPAARHQHEAAPEDPRLKPGTRIVSNSFTMGDWESDQTSTVSPQEGCETSWCTAHLWIVPARVEGTHKLPFGELMLKQKFQMLSGTLEQDGKTYALHGKVRGNEVSFQAGGKEYRGA